ncbi:hypothetical protein [Branchiibius sp. NY16-3462-2]|uniref:alpha/beta hydrolase n=1 Tax=Branchiibius sp. NY16-3462-2 TaxID=1807500 RepID=UPI0025BFAE31|nr:hypothetical protein [Branchiibius sp. NY16-3462-2]
MRLDPVRRLVFPAPAPVAFEPAAPARLVHWAGGAMLHADVGSELTVLHFHGNGDDLRSCQPLVASVAGQGVSMAVVEYPGYGVLSGQQTTAPGLLAAARAAAARIPGRVVLSGFSLGTAVATVLAADGVGERLVLTAPFTSSRELVRDKWLQAFWPVFRDRFDSASLAPSISIPALVQQGDRDRVLPFSHGQRLAGLLQDAVFRPLPGRGHGDLDPLIADAVVRAATVPDESWREIPAP